MGRVNRLMERRVLRRAADQALVTSLISASPTHAGGAADQDFDYTRSAGAGASFDDEPTTEPIPVAEAQEVEPARPGDHAWDDSATPGPADVYDLVPNQPDVPEPPDDHRWDEHHGDVVPSRVVAAAYFRPELDFAVTDYRDKPWYRTKLAAAVVIAAVIVAALWGAWLVIRSSATTAEQSPTDAPISTPPVPTMARPSAVSAPPAPPPPPPPPPPAAPAGPMDSAPQQQYWEPRYSQPTPAQKPRVDVTRAPMSVAPVPKPIPGSDSSTPGDGGDRRRGCFGFC